MIKLSELKAKVEDLSEDDKKLVNDLIDILNSGVPFKEVEHFREFIELKGIDKVIEAKAHELQMLRARKDGRRANLRKEPNPWVTLHILVGVFGGGMFSMPPLFVCHPAPPYRLATPPTSIKNRLRRSKSGSKVSYELTSRISCVGLLLPVIEVQSAKPKPLGFPVLMKLA